MSNQQLIKSAHIWALTLLLACGLFALAGKAGVTIESQNQNQNGNANGNGNSNTGNQNQNQNQNQNSNTNASGNRNMGAQTGMANMSSQDRNFVMEAAMGGLMEVELGRIAAQQGASDAVKQFGQRMVDDHTKANTELMTLATSKGLTLPTALDEKHQKEVTKLSGMSGAEFDRAYAKMMLSDHRKDVSNFEKQSNRGGDPDIKAFAAATLPTLQQHLQMTTTLPGNENANVNTGGGGTRSTNRNMNDNGNMNGNSNMNGNMNSNSNRNRNNNGNSNNSNRP